LQQENEVQELTETDMHEIVNDVILELKKKHKKT